MNVYLVCFDISDDRIRTRVSKLLERYGDRVQKSVFEITLRSPAALKKLQQQLTDLMLPEEHQLRFYRLCSQCRQTSHDLSGQAIADFPAMIIV
jgi:CRISPR-associated protein Cas2